MYSGTQDVIDSIGGTKNYSIGTAGSCDMDFNYLNRMIQRADDIIDSSLSDIYGSYAFGTSAYGTYAVPNMIKGISGDLAGWLVIDNLAREISASEAAKGKRLYDRAMGFLEKISKQEMNIPGWEQSNAYIPKSSTLLFNVEETIQLNGTLLTKLAWEKVMYQSGIVMNTTLDGTITYTADVDYKIYYYDERITGGTNAGYIRRLGTTITDGQFVRVLYQVKKEPVFSIRDARLYGHYDSGVGNPRL